jgi:ParB-like chromosome segregation protein Spo0J
MTEKKKKLRKVEYRVIKLEKLKPAKYNPRIITEAQLDQLEKSIELGGLIEPIIVNKDMTVIGGHQRLRILTERFDTDEEMCVVVDYDKKTEQKMNLALNKIQGFWNEELLVDLIFDMKEDEIPGFEEEEKDQYLMQKEMMLKNQGSYDPDEDEDIKKMFERNEKVPVKVEEPDAPHRKDQLAFYTENFEQYDAIRKFFKTNRQGELDVEKLYESIEE